MQDKSHRTVPSLYSRGRTIPRDARVTRRADDATGAAAGGTSEADSMETALSEGDPSSSTAVSRGSECAHVRAGVSDSVAEEGAGDDPAAEDPVGHRGRAGNTRSSACAHDAADEGAREANRARSKEIRVDPKEDLLWQSAPPLFSPENSNESYE